MRGKFRFSTKILTIRDTYAGPSPLIMQNNKRKGLTKVKLRLSSKATARLNKRIISFRLSMNMEKVEVKN